MNFTRMVSTTILLLLTGFMGMFFTNCGEVQMDAPETQPVAEEQDGDVFKIDSDDKSSFEKLSEHDLEMIGTRLNEIELGQFRPLSDLNDPSIQNLYFCPSAINKYLVCHVPSHLGVPAEEGCMSVEAVEQHIEHESLLEDDTGDLVEAYDYLGPCRHNDQGFFKATESKPVALNTMTNEAPAGQSNK